jgi:hypothetical protein
MEKERKKTLVAVIKGTKSQVIDVLNKIPLEKKSVKEITLDMANNMQWLQECVS